MKKTFLALAALGAFAGAAHAQSSVTLYGIVDEGLSYTNNVATGMNPNGTMTHGSLFALQSGVLQGSRFGLTGTEDLGGGMKAIFKLENGFDVNSGKLGQGGLMFGRQAYVGLGSNQYGTVTLGRQYDSVVDNLGPLTANGNWGGMFFSHPFDNDNTNNSFRINNSVKYTSANYAGFTFGGLYGFSNAAGQFANNRAWSLGARYANGPLTVAAAYLDAQHPGATCGGAITGASQGTTACTGAEFGGKLPALGLSTVDKLRTGGLGASYAFGPATAGVVVTESSYLNPMSYTRFLNVEANVQYFVTPALTLGAMYDYTHTTASALGFQMRPHFNTVGLMSDYHVSKRTDLYAQTVFQNGSSGTEGAVAVVGAGGVSASNSQFVARVGIRHKF